MPMRVAKTGLRRLRRSAPRNCGSSPPRRAGTPRCAAAKKCRRRGHPARSLQPRICRPWYPSPRNSNGNYERTHSYRGRFSHRPWEARNRKPGRPRPSEEAQPPRRGCGRGDVRHPGGSRRRRRLRGSAGCRNPRRPVCRTSAHSDEMAALSIWNLGNFDLIAMMPRRATPHRRLSPRAFWSRRARSWAHGSTRRKAQRDAYRPNERILPSNFASKTSWERYLDALRQRRPAVLADILPDLTGVALVLDAAPDFVDPSRINLRAAIENGAQIPSRQTFADFEPSLFQVGLQLTLPSALHQPLRLDRVQPSYRFKDWLTYPAMGLNCGVQRAALGRGHVPHRNHLGAALYPAANRSDGHRRPTGELR